MQPLLLYGLSCEAATNEITSYYIHFKVCDTVKKIKSLKMFCREYLVGLLTRYIKQDSDEVKH